MILQTHRKAIAALPVLAVFLLAAEPLVAAEGGDGGWGVLLFIGRLFNLAVVAAILVWIARQPLANFFASRTEAIREQLADAQRARAEAEAKLAEIESKMSRLDQELIEMKAAADRDAQGEYARLAQAAEEGARKLVEKARQEIDGMTREAYLSLKAYAAELAVTVAEERIREQMTAEDRDRLFARFLSGLGGTK